MTQRPTFRLALSLAAITTAVLGCTATAETDIVGQATHGTTSARLACSVDIAQRGNGFTMTPVVRSLTALTGTYHLQVEGPGTRMTQGGPFSLQPEERLELGRLQMSGSPSALTTQMTLTVDGATYRCPTSS